METKTNTQKRTNSKQNKRQRLGQKISTTNEKIPQPKMRERERENRW